MIKLLNSDEDSSPEKIELLPLILAQGVIQFPEQGFVHAAKGGMELDGRLYDLAVGYGRERADFVWRNFEVYSIPVLTPSISDHGALDRVVAECYAQCPNFQRAFVLRPRQLPALYEVVDLSDRLEIFDSPYIAIKPTKPVSKEGLLLT